MQVALKILPALVSAWPAALVCHMLLYLGDAEIFTGPDWLDLHMPWSCH